VYIDTELDFDDGLLNIDATNTEIHIDAKLDLKDGTQNQHIGENAGKYITGGVTSNLVPSNSIFIGSGTEAEADGQTNQIVIGYDATGNGSNTVTIGKSINEVYIDGIESSTIANAANVYVDANNRLWKSTTGAGAFDTIYASGTNLIFVTNEGDTLTVPITFTSDNWGTQVGGIRCNTRRGWHNRWGVKDSATGSDRQSGIKVGCCAWHMEASRCDFVMVGRDWRE